MWISRLGRVTGAACAIALLAGNGNHVQTWQIYGTDPASNATLVYVGTKTKGIHLFRLQTDGLEVSQNITLVPLGVAAETQNPSFVEADFARRLLFTVNEIDEFEGKPSGAVSAFAIERATGKLTLLNQRASLGRRPCQLALDKDKRSLLVANCGSGGLAVMPVGVDGRLGEPVLAAASATKATNGDESATNARCLTFDPANRFVFTCQGDVILTYRFDAAKGALAPGEPLSTPLKTGAGPRYMAFRPDGKFAYVGNESSSTITAFEYEPTAGGLKDLQTISTLPEYYDGPNQAAEVGMHPTGKYLYVSNRGHNSVVLFSIDPAKGTLTYVEEQGTGGKNPRHFGLEPSARHLAIVNQDSDTVLASRIDSGNGRLKPSGVFASAPAPLFVKFVPPPDAVK
jgi:6-phosphogluconolactonase